MKKEITHSYVNERIMEHLEFNSFYEMLQDSRYKGFLDQVTLPVHFIFESKYDFQFDVEINGTCISKPNSFTAVNITNKNEYEFKVIGRGDRRETLQDMFDDWYMRYRYWLYDVDEPLNIMNDYKNFM